MENSSQISEDEINVVPERLSATIEELNIPILSHMPILNILI